MPTLSLELTARDVEPEDLPGLEWSGGPAHLRVVAENWQRTLEGEVSLRCLALRSGVLVALGGLDLAKSEGVGELWMLSVRQSWQGLGVGTALVADLESRARRHGRALARLSVEDDNPRAAALYRRLGYRAVGRRDESWPLDDSLTHRTTTTVMEREL